MEVTSKTTESFWEKTGFCDIAYQLYEEVCKDLHFFVKVLTILSSSRDGVHHAGELLGQHLRVIGGAVGVFPLPVATFGVVGNTKA
eukprot:1617778-Ditylum_brightwellii.AAC.1